ncbi:MAG: DNA polymerase domain-containing protein [Nanoarchaeota archaeon]
MPKLQFYLYDINYKIVGGKPVIYLFGTTLDGQQVCIKDDSFAPYFYVEEKEGLKEKIEKLKVEEENETFYVTNIEQENKKLLEKEIALLKIFVNVPKAVNAIREIIKAWDIDEFEKPSKNSQTHHKSALNTDAKQGYSNPSGIKIFEYDISFTRRYIIDKNLLPMNLVQAECEKIIEQSRVPVYSGKKIEQFNEDQSPNPKILSFDIETYSQKNKRIDPENQSILMLAVYGQNLKKVITWKSFKTNDETIEFVKSESEVIERFKEIISDYKPDIITGYFSDGFDFPFIKTRAKKYKTKLDLGLDFSELHIEGKKIQTAEITGIVHVDIFKFIKKIMGRSMETDVFTLDAVSNEILGEHKHEVEIGELTSAWDNSDAESLNKFIKYNLHDAELVFNLCTKLLPNIIELVKIVGLPLFDIPRLSFSQLVEWYVIRQAKQANELIPNKPDHREQEIRFKKRIHGAFVYEPTPGFYENIAVFDYRSLYPSIIASHNISPGTFRCECCADKKAVPYEEARYWFCQNKKGFVSRIIEDLITRRARIKEMLKKQKNPLLSARSDALKLLANSFYGYLGFSAARWYFIEGAESTTAFGRHYIKKVISKAEEQGFKVLYSDSLPHDRMIFVKTPKGDIKLKKIGELYENFKEGYKTLSYDTGGNVTFKNILQVIRHELGKENKLLKINTKYGTTIVTNQHSVYSYTDGMKLTKGEDLKKGDYLISLTKPELSIKYFEGTIFDIAEMKLREYSDKLFLYKDDNKFPPKKGKCPYCGKTVYLSTHVNLQHKERKCKLNKNSKFKFVGADTALVGKIPRYWKLDEELAWLMGFYCAEGSVSESNTKTGIKHLLSFGGQDINLIKKVKKIIDNRIGANLKIIENFDKRINKKMYYYRLQRVPIVPLFKYGFDCGKGSEFKRVPFFIFNAEEKLKKAFIKGYLDGDGQKEKDKRYLTKFIRFSTKSKELAIGLQFLLKSLDLGKNHFGKEIKHVSWSYRKDKPKICTLRVQSAKKSENNFCLAEIRKIEQVPNEKYVYDLEVKNSHNFVDAEGMILVHNTDSVFLLLDKKTKNDAIKFVEQVNLDLPGIMELDYENYYPAGIFVSTKAKEMGAKKKYALIDEKNNLKIRGFETVRRNWSFIAKEVQKEVLKIILKDKDAKKAAEYVKKMIGDLRANKIPTDKMVIFTQLQKEISEYASAGPHVAAAQRMKDKGIDVGPGSMIKFVIIKGDGIKKSTSRIRDRVRLLEEISQKDYDSEYYIENQILPSVERIFAVFSIDILKFVEKQGQSTLGGW